MSFSHAITEVLDDLRQGRMIILADLSRENEGDLMIAADKITPQAVNFMIRFAKGLVCLSLTQQKCQQLQLPLMTDNPNPATAFTHSVDAAHGIGSGVSAYDRAHTIKTVVQDDCNPTDLIRPGHIFPLRAHPGGLLHRKGQTEGSLELLKLAGLKPAAVLCEIINDDGTMAKRDDLLLFAKQHQLKIFSLDDLIVFIKGNAHV